MTVDTMSKENKSNEYIEKNLESTIQDDENVYFGSTYLNEKRFISYYYQFKEIIKSSPESVLEIGPGNKIISFILKNKNIKVITLDIDKRLDPEILADVNFLPLDSDSFDLVSCCEVLEHIPFENFRKSLSELKGISKSKVIISLPDAEKYFKFSFQLPNLYEYKRLIKIPFQSFEKPNKEENTHYWEINKKGYPLKKIKNEIREVGFEIEKTYRPFENPKHRFFILKN